MTLYYSADKLLATSKALDDIKLVKTEVYTGINILLKK